MGPRPASLAAHPERRVLENLTGRLQRILKDLGGRGRLGEDNMREGLREIRMALLEADVSLPVARRFIDRVRDKAMGQEVLASLSPGQHVVKILRDELQALLGGGDAALDLSGAAPVVLMLVGLQGSGKTSTSAKLAFHLRGRGRSPLLVPADLRRPAAVDQLKVLGRENDLVVHDSAGATDPRAVCRAALDRARSTGFDSMVVDTAGRLHLDADLMREAADLVAILRPREVLYVADAMTGQDAVHSAAAFAAALPLTGVVLTKLDGDARGGAALSIRETAGVPIKLAGVGEKAKDLEVFHPDRMASRIIGMGDVLTLIEKAEAVSTEEDAQRLAEALSAGEFTLEDLRDQMRRLKRMGPLGSLLDLIPGLSSLGRPADLDDSALKVTTAILDSMTPHERRNPSVVSGSRRRRIARGSGTSVQEINKLLKQYVQMRKMMKSMSRAKGARAGLAGLPFRPR